ncbi:S41 family peptidase [Candidatus Saccharibacteria bacterium]|nr:S41 family peptidase [Candidatus Saccharibacteria bacterium]MBH1972926.1 S41 family peptidase [Candidatus Saccharibacteria bacterium]MBH1991128.1 S41 family peptidase [Candidatus Saccharibacteria bacterium]OGL23103.1 MAG: hypothetical protein A2791_05500 [Candidatus Saccharibacteria bacterium RIFCSPHIGHO2_01_FULL_46_30]
MTEGEYRVTEAPKNVTPKRAKQKKWSMMPSTFVLIIGVAVVVGYGAGTRNDQIMGTVGPFFGLRVASGEIDLSNVQETYRQLKANFNGELDEQAMKDGASRGLVASAGDDYTVFLSQKEAKSFDDDLNGNVGAGIGAEIGLRSDKPTVIRPLKDSPALKAGIEAGDVIVKVNDEVVTSEWTVNKTVEKIKGEAGTTVKLSVLRDGEVKEFTVTRDTINSPSVESRIDGKLGVLTISRFDGTTTDLARKAAQSFKDQGVEKVILDLRNNGGGVLGAAQDVSGLWLRDKVVVSERRGEKVTDELRSGNNPILEGMPTVVLVNGGSASASEIVAGALQDHKAATLIGEKTFGKGSVQQLISLPDSAVLKVTVARWYTPNGKNINKEGIQPNEKIEMTRDDVNAGRDPQLEAAQSKLQ